MISDISEIFEGLGRLNIGYHPTSLTTRDGAGRRRSRSELEESAGETVQQLHRAATTVAGSTPQQSTAAAPGSLQQQLSAIDKLLRQTSEDTEDKILGSLISLSTSDLHATLQYFREALRQIVQQIRKVLNIADDTALWRILEQCYNQSVSETGSLWIERYFDAKEDDHLETHNHDVPSEDCDENRNRLQVEESYAKAERQRPRRVINEEKKRRLSTHCRWRKLWIDALALCSNGPLLFSPPIVRSWRQEELPECPQYLFRVSDRNSSGKSDENIVASAASNCGSSFSKLDLLSLPAEQVSEELMLHLDKGCFGEGDLSDNLMSWSSSLLFVIQYALWRSHKTAKKGISPADIQICAVDTTKFPRGQFARDLWLMNYCRERTARHAGLENLFRLRTSGGYDNGEYLSQGTVNHKGRSCVFSLQDLIDAGLFKVYPELKEGNDKWTNRVKDLREVWKWEQATTLLDFAQAQYIGEACCPEFPMFEIALLLLTFKSRPVQPEILKQGQVRLESDDVFCSNVNKHQSFSVTPQILRYGPVEVQRYHEAKMLYDHIYGELEEDKLRLIFIAQKYQSSDKKLKKALH